MQLEPSHLTQGHAQKEDIRSSANRSIRPSSSIERDATSLGRGRIGQLVPVPRVSDRRALENGEDQKRRTEENVEHDGKPQKTANSDTGEDIQVEETERQLHLRHERDVEELRDVKVEAKRRQIRLGQRPYILAECVERPPIVTAMQERPTGKAVSIVQSSVSSRFLLPKKCLNTRRIPTTKAATEPRMSVMTLS